MKKFLFPILFSMLLLAACNPASEQKPVLIGTIENPITDTVTLSYWTQEDNTWKEIVDTCRIVDGHFSFDLQITNPTKAELFFDRNNYTVLYIEPKRMEIFLFGNSVFDYTLTNCEIENEYKPLRKQIANSEDSMNILVYNNLEPLILKFEQTQNKDDLQIAREYHSEKISTIVHFRNKIQIENLEYIKTNPNSLIAAGQLLYIIKRAELEEYTMDSAKILYSQLSDEVKKSQLGQLAQKQIQDFESDREKEEALNIGKKAPDFSAISLLNGETIRLSDYKGKSYVLLDFWASWCRPCLEGLPFMKKIHEKYSKKNFVIIGISCDDKKDAYMNAIEKHGLRDWPQIMDVQDFDKSQKGSVNKEDIKEKYYIQGIPTYLLLNPDGEIIGKWIGSDKENEQEMTKMMESIFKK